jgi:hypothetical protein
VDYLEMAFATMKPVDQMRMNSAGIAFMIATGIRRSTTRETSGVFATISAPDPAPRRVISHAHRPCRDATFDRLALISGDARGFRARSSMPDPSRAGQ